MILSLITNDPDDVELALGLGVDRILVDLEIETKLQRQQGRNLFLSDHTVEDLARIKKAHPGVNTTVRINSIHTRSYEQITKIAEYEPARVMLPFIESLNQIDTFLRLLPKTIEPVLLLENRFSLKNLPMIIRDYPIGEVYIGLNDLSLDLGYPNLVLTLLHPLFRHSVEQLRYSQLTWGFGGIGSFTQQNLPIAPQAFFEYQLCLDAQTGWLSRSFRELFRGPNSSANVSAAISQLRARMIVNGQRSVRDKANRAQVFEESIAEDWSDYRKSCTG